jgi:hypothetical protein
MCQPILYEIASHAAAMSNPTIPDKTQDSKKYFVTIVATQHEFVLYTFAALTFSPTQA